MIHITRHALTRYQERVRPVSEAEARQALSSTAIQLAIQIGAPFVKLGTGQHVVIEDGRIVTVLPEYANPRLFSAAVSQARLMEFEGKV